MLTLQCEALVYALTGNKGTYYSAIKAEESLGVILQ